MITDNNGDNRREKKTYKSKKKQNSSINKSRPQNLRFSGSLYHHLKSINSKETGSISLASKCAKNIDTMDPSGLSCFHSKYKEGLKVYGFNLITTLADGNCFFRALSHHLQGNDADFADYREHICEYLIVNRVTYGQHFSDEILNTEFPEEDSVNHSEFIPNTRKLFFRVLFPSDMKKIIWRRYSPLFILFILKIKVELNYITTT